MVAPGNAAQIERRNDAAPGSPARDGAFGHMDAVQDLRAPMPLKALPPHRRLHRPSRRT